MQNRITESADFVFEPKVWSDHSMAYFDKKLVYGAFALRNDELEAEGKGVVVNFPYYKSIGAAEDLTENVAMGVDNLKDDSFSATVFEKGKAVGVTETAFMESADTQSGVMSEAQRQIGRVLAEAVDMELNDEITSFNGNKKGPIGVETNQAKYDNMLMGFQATKAEDKFNIRNLAIAQKRGFGDKSSDAKVIFVHPMQTLDSDLDTQSGFLKADANMPYSAINGFIGMLKNMAIIESESVKKLPAKIGGKDAYLAHMHKVNSYGIIQKKDVTFKLGEQILNRQVIVRANQWYGVKSFHAKINSDDTKAVGMITTAEYDLA